MESSVDIIKSKLSIVDVVGSYIKLEKAGINYRARCPFHNEKTPSFFVSLSRGTYHCFGCSKGGDIFAFVEDMEGLAFKDALVTLADRAGVTLTNASNGITNSKVEIKKVLEFATKYYEDQLESSKVATEYLASRGLVVESIKKFRLGYAPTGWQNLYDSLIKAGFKDRDILDAGLSIMGQRGYYDRFRERIMFPFVDLSGQVVGFSARVLPGAKDEMGKYINSPEGPLFHKSRVFYGLDQAKRDIREQDKILLVEGQLDVIMAHQVGSTNTIGVSGTALTEDHVKILNSQSSNLVLVLDGDQAGFRASERSVRLALESNLYVSVVELPQGDDPASLIHKDVNEWHRLIARGRPFLDYVMEAIKKIFPEARDLQGALGQYIYPYISSTNNDIEKDRSIQAVADLMGVAHDSVRADFAKWISTNTTTKTVGSNNANKSVSTEVRLDHLDMILDMLWGLVYYQESLGSDMSKPKERLDLLMASKQIANRRLRHNEERVAELTFMAEAHYQHNKDITTELERLFDRLSKELLKHELGEAMDNLRVAELENDKGKITEILKQCQIISTRLGQLKK